ncbi:sulfurtransferase [Lysobacter sp. GX 14042]|uniref:sulfurtransferase n=1 Tax=Lysobacter sp. GX 14042 TaxID=2907155 RepID=UPI001F47FAE6|nr:sulfurtransferase [Lysobacter sp. GX 14042]MCE7033217.1 sulfurtransferase [Lysobacter sp. GX 14042]
MDTAPHWQTLVQPEDLAAALGRDDLVVVDARASLADPGSCRTAWELEHIPGARFADLDEDLTKHGLGGGRHPWPDADGFTTRLGRWGISPRHQVVAYDNGDGGLAAARFWFLMRALGHVRVAVLDGGWQRWKALGLPVSADAPPNAAADYPGRFDAQRLLDAGQVQAHLDAGGMLVDARAPERFRGEVEPMDTAAGHVPGAVNRPYARNLQDGRFKSPDQLRAEFGELLGDRDPDEVVVMCGSAVTACHHLLAMEHAGLPGARLFTGSWSGWIEDPARPVATGEA